MKLHHFLQIIALSFENILFFNGMEKIFLKWSPKASEPILPLLRFPDEK
jgi:hypothetical protein